MTRSRLFETFLKTAERELQTHAAGLSSNPAYGIDAQICVRVDETAEATAFVRWNFEDSCYDIILTLGLCVWAFEVAAIVAAHVDSHPEENSALNLDFSNYQYLSRKQIEDRIEAAAQLFPDNQKAYCEYVFGGMLLAVFQHEVAHIVSGHINYLKSVSNNAASIDELHILTLSQPQCGDVPPLFFEYEADHVGSQLLAEAATSSAPPLSRWANGSRRDNMLFGLFGFTVFTLALEEAARLRDVKAPGYPSPMLRFSVAITGAKRIWDEERTGEEFLNAIMIPLGQILTLFETIYPAVGFLRDFTDPDWQKSLESEIDAMLNECSPYIDRVGQFSLFK